MDTLHSGFSELSPELNEAGDKAVTESPMGMAGELSPDQSKGAGLVWEVIAARDDGKPSRNPGSQGQLS